MTVANQITLVRILLIPVFVAFAVYYSASGRDGAPDGPNLEFDVPADGAVMRFAWDARTHRLDVTSP